MMPATEVIDALCRSGQLWEVAPGLVGLGGQALQLFQRLEERVTRIARAAADEEWRVPPALSFASLARAQYFASFPQWLTVASHLSPDPVVLERLATAETPEVELTQAVAPPEAALAPAVCYHAYARLSGRTIDAERRITLQSTCWRHEGERLCPLERGWAFTMREVVYVGTPNGVARFLEQALTWVTRLALELGLSIRLEEASDPFFAPTARGRALLQKMKGLKREVLVPLEQGGRSLAVASLNDHELHFGEAFDLRLPDGQPASSACVAFGLERLLLGVLMQHGVDAAAWPAALQKGDRP